MADDRPPALQATSTSTAWWEELPTPEKAKLWDEVAPGTCQKMLDETHRQVVHMRRLAWAKLGVTCFGLACGLATVIMFVWLATYYADHGAATQGAAIIGSLAAVVAVFVTGKVLVDARGQNRDEDKGDG